LDAAIDGDAQAVAAWLDGDGSVDASSCGERNGATLLVAAAYGGQEAGVRMLLQRGASVNLLQGSLGFTALMAAALNGHTAIVQVLPDAKADASLQTKIGYTALMVAERHKHTAAAQLLRQHAQGQAAEAEAGAAALATHAAATVGEEEAEKEAAEKEAAAKTATLGTATFDAAANGEAQAVAAWLHKGGGVEAGCAEHHDATLLMAAAAGGHEAMVRRLLQRGASVNLQDSLGATVLMLAAFNGHTTIVQVLLDAKADASLQANGCTALMVAEHHKQTATAQLLRQHAQGQAAVEAGRRVRIAGLKGRPELNGRSGMAGRFDAAKGRYEVVVDGEAEAVLLKPANLQEASFTFTLTPSPK
jgi:ankyrin repeat protein